MNNCLSHKVCERGGRNVTAAPFIIASATDWVCAKFGPQMSQRSQTQRTTTGRKLKKHVQNVRQRSPHRAGDSNTTKQSSRPVIPGTGSQKITRANAACASVRLSPQTGACNTPVIGAPWKIAGIAPRHSLFIWVTGAALLVGSKGLLVIKGQGGPLSHSTTAQRTAQTQTKQQTTTKMRIFRIALPQYLLFGSHYMSMRLITPCTACIGIL